MRFTVDGEPKGKARARTVRNGDKVHSFTPKSTVEYEQLVKVSYLSTENRGIWFNNEPLSINIIAYFQPPKRFTKSDREKVAKGVIFPVKKPDADNIAKIICDALNGVAYRDDAQIVDCHITKRYGEPRVEVMIKEYCG